MVTSQQEKKMRDGLEGRLKRRTQIPTKNPSKVMRDRRYSHIKSISATCRIPQMKE